VYIKKNSPPSKQALLISLYFLICLNPYEEFKDIAIDFHNFYEQNENLAEEELQDRIN
jgi:serine/threonine-protein kinase ULK/ATG1